MLKAFEALDETRRQELGNDLLALIGRTALTTAPWWCQANISRS
jgi:hypothetical protein